MWRRRFATASDIIGVVTVAKPNRSVQPFIERAQQRLGVLAGAFIVAALVIGALLSFWLSRAIRRLTVYADAVAAGGRPDVPATAWPRACAACEGAGQHALAA